MAGTQNVQGINAIAIARGKEEPSNRNVLWLDENITGSFYKIIKCFNLELGKWELLSRSNLELLSDLKTVDGKGSGLDADTIQGLTPEELSGGSDLPSLSVGQIIAGQSDTIGIAKTVGGVVTMDVDGNFAYIPNSISHTGLSDIGTNTHAQIDTHISNTSNPHSVTASQVGNTLPQWNANGIEGNLTNLGTLGAGQDGYSITWDNATSRFITTSVDSIYNSDGELSENRIISGGGTKSLSLGDNVLNENLGYIKTNSIQGLEQFASSFPITNAGLEVIKNPANFIANVKSSATDYSQFRLQSDEFIVNSFLGTNNYMHSSTPSLSSTIISDGGAGTDSRLLLYGSGRVDLGTTGSVGAYITLDTSNTFTDRNTTPKGLEYTLDYSANYTNRSLVDKEYVDNNAGGDSIYTADGTLTGNRTIDLDTKTLTIDGTSSTSLPFTVNSKEVYSGIGTFFRVNLNGGISVRGSSGGDGNISAYSGHPSSQPRIFHVGRFGGGEWYGGAVTIGTSSTSSKLQKTDTNVDFYDVNNILRHKIGLSTGSNNQHTRFFYSGYTNNGRFIIGSSATISTENISLQGSTLIKGNGTSTGSALSIYDNDTTPNKLWDFLDNGNVNLGGNSVINQDSNVLQFSNINSIGGLKFNGTSNNGIGLNLANGSNDFDFVVAGSSNTLIGTGSLGLLIGGAWGMQIKQNREISIGTNFEPVAGYDLSVDKAYFDTEITVKSPAGIMQFNGYRTNVVNPSTPTFPNDKDFGLHKNTATGRCFLGYNDGGTIKFVQLTTSGVPNPSVQETTSTATFTINADEETTGVLTAMASATTIASPTGTPVQGQNLIFRFKDNGTARALTWNAIFRAIGITLPTTTTANKLLYVGCKYNSTDTKWDVVSVQEEA